MFCPQCGLNQSEDLKFCKQCGANLHAVRQVVATRDAGGKINWDKTWVAEMFLSGAEHTKRQHELEQLRGITPAVKRYREIKAGVIVSSIGLALMIFLGTFMEGLVQGGNIPPDAAPVLLRIWVAGVIPLFVGLGLIINGVFVSKKLVALAEQEARAHNKTADVLEQNAAPALLPSADTTEFSPANFSVTEDTTKHLQMNRRQQ